MLNLVALIFIAVFLVVWIMLCVRGYDFNTPYYVNSVTRLELQLLKVNLITRLIAVGSVAVTCFALSATSYFVDMAHSKYVFNPKELPYTDLIHLILLFLAMFTFAANSIYQKGLTQLGYQKANPSQNIVKSVKKFNVLFNVGVILFALCFDAQLIYRALNINI